MNNIHIRVLVVFLLADVILYLVISDLGFLSSLTHLLISKVDIKLLTNELWCSLRTILQSSLNKSYTWNSKIERTENFFDRFSFYRFISAQKLSEPDSFVVFEEPLDDFLKLRHKEDFGIVRWVEKTFWGCLSACWLINNFCLIEERVHLIFMTRECSKQLRSLSNQTPSNFA